jgi:hypothetical protein
MIIFLLPVQENNNEIARHAEKHKMAAFRRWIPFLFFDIIKPVSKHQFVGTKIMRK